MAVPDIGLAPPPPPNVAAQLRPSAPGPMMPPPPGGAAPPAGAPNLQQILMQLGGNAPPALSSDVTPKILAVEPLLQTIARQVPALGPDVDRLNIELQARMGGLPQALASMGAPYSPSAPQPGGLSAGAGAPLPPAAGPVSPTGPAAAPAPPPQLPPGAGMGSPGSALGAGPGQAPPTPGAAPPGMPPTPTPSAGALDTAVQLEVLLPQIGQQDPTVMPYIQGFIARLRVEVPKVVSGDTESITPPQQAAPTESMLSKIPVSY